MRGERHKVRCISIVGRNNLPWTLNCELDMVVRARSNEAVIVRHPNCHEGQVATIGLNLLPIGRGLQPSWIARGLHDIGSPEFAVLVGYGL